MLRYASIAWTPFALQRPHVPLGGRCRETGRHLVWSGGVTPEPPIPSADHDVAGAELLNVRTCGIGVCSGVDAVRHAKAITHIREGSRGQRSVAPDQTHLIVFRPSVVLACLVAPGRLRCGAPGSLVGSC